MTLNNGMTFERLAQTFSAPQLLKTIQVGKLSMQQLKMTSAEAAIADTILGYSEKLQLAAKLVEEVAYEQAGNQSAKVIEHLILVAASLQRLAQRPDEAEVVVTVPVLVTV